MIESLDVASITVVGLATGVALAIAMLLNWLVQKQQPGVALWATGFTLGSAGFILIGVRNHIPAFWSVVVANGLLTCCWCCLWMGLRRFVGRSSSQWPLASLLLIVHLGLISYYLYAVPDVGARIVV